METTVITSDMVRRRIIFDCMSDPQKACALAGMIGVSEEGAQKEEEDSLLRLSQVTPILPLLEVFSDWLAELAVQFQLTNIDPEDVPEEFRLHMLDMFQTVIRGSVASTISVLNDLGLVTVAEVEDVS